MSRAQSQQPAGLSATSLNYQQHIEASRSGDRIDQIRRLLRQRGLRGLILVGSGGHDPCVAAVLRSVRHSLSGEQAQSSTQEGCRYQTPARLGGVSLWIGLEGRVRGLPESSWELGELARCGVQPIDPRVFPEFETWNFTERCHALAKVCGVSDGDVGVSCAAAVNSDREGESGESGESGEIRAGSPPSTTAVRLRSAGAILDLVRRHKTPAEIAEVERVAGVSDQAFREVARLLAAAIVDHGELWLGGSPLTVRRLQTHVQKIFHQARLVEPEGHLIAVGETAAEPHGNDGDQIRVRSGEAVLVDLFPKGELFSDCTRTFCVRPLGRGGMNLMLAAGQVASAKKNLVSTLERRLLRTGWASGFQLQQETCAEFRRLGWNTQLDDQSSRSGFVHGLGHGVGDELHEPPSFARQHSGKMCGKIMGGDVITLEPALYQPGEWGVRFEDLYLVEERDQGKAGLRQLTRLPWALNPKEFLAGSSAAIAPPSSSVPLW